MEIEKIKKESAELLGKENKLIAREKELDEKTKQFDEQKKRLDQSIENNRKEKEDVRTKDAVAQNIQKELEKRSAELDAREKKLRTTEAELATITDMLIIDYKKRYPEKSEEEIGRTFDRAYELRKRVLQTSASKVEISEETPSEILPPAERGESPFDEDKTLGEAESLFDKREYDKAMQLYEKLVQNTDKELALHPDDKGLLEKRKTYLANMEECDKSIKP